MSSSSPSPRRGVKRCASRPPYLEIMAKRAKQKEALQDPHSIFMVDPIYPSDDSFLATPRFPRVQSTETGFLGSHVAPDATALPPPRLSHLRVMRGDYTAVPILFKSSPHATTGWDDWVTAELKSKSLRDKLSNAGVLSAILTSRRFGIHRDLDSLRYLLRRWHRDTHTFFCSWGEITPTLDDVAALYDLPIVGTHSLMDPPASADCDALIAELTKSIHAC